MTRPAVSRAMTSRRAWPWSRRGLPGEGGDTLIEVLIAVVIIAIASIALIGGLTTSITSSAEHRSLATLDTVLKNFAEAAKYEIQEQPTPLYSACPTNSNYRIVSAPEPSTGTPGVQVAALAGSAVTVFATDFTAGKPISVVLGSSPVTGVPASGVSPAVVPASGNVAVTFTVPEIPNAGSGLSEPVWVSDGTATESASNLEVEKWVGAPSPSSVTAGQVGVTIPVSGFPSGATLTLSINGIPITPSSGGTADSTGSSLVTFTVPAALTPNPNGYSVIVTGGTQSLSSSENLYVGYTAPPLQSNSTSVANYAVDISSIQYWGGSSGWTTTCSGSPNTQLVTVTATGPNGVSDTLSFVVINPTYSTPTALTSNVAFVASPASPASQGSSATSVTFTATVTGNGVVTPTGFVYWTITPPSGVTPVCAASTLSSSATGTCTVNTGTALGGYTVSAAYSGDANYTASSSGNQSWTLQDKPNVTVTGATSGSGGKILTFTATVAGTVPGDPTPTGTVAWSGVTCSSTMALNAGVATCTINNASTTTNYTATAAYTPNGSSPYYNPSSGSGMHAG